MTIVRHFTATAFVVHNGSVALHWHPKVGAWLPPGGHIEDNENPVQAVLREVEEETGLAVDLVATTAPLDLGSQEQVEPPFTIVIEDINDPEKGYHQHIDLIYFCRLKDQPSPLNLGWRWVSRQEIASLEPLDRDGGPPEPPPHDVRTLALHAIAFVRA
ncbi:MAG: NUDIX domain-containing protein [Chloroflexota bacterium]|nr:NUDIX domain-containing protein [Chloroflexota bacterium]MDE2942468.1 NUDIX domain-containing protein [Chloroflexota bacterium]MDE3267852.1 NUDIX domain-containing protein [Chloroflexota bacterium]